MAERDNFMLFTQQDRQDLSYGVCMGTMALSGVAVGRFAGLWGVLGGAVAGVLAGLVACRRLSPAIEQKLFTADARFSEAELLEVLLALHLQGGAATKREGMYVLTAVRHGARSQGLRRSALPPVCPPMRVAVSQILAARNG